MHQGSGLDPNDVLSLRLTEEERDFLIQTTLSPPYLVRKLRFGIVAEHGLVFRLTLDELDELAGYVAAAANHADDDETQAALDRIYGRIVDVIGTHTGDMPPIEVLNQAFSLLPPDIVERMSDFIDPNHPPSVDELNEKLDELTNEYKHRPIPEMAGLSPVQIGNLIYCDWDDEPGAVSLNEELSVEDIEGARMFYNARFFLKTALEADGVKATQAGNLNRKFVVRMLDGFHWPAKFEPGWWHCFKAPNEQSFAHLHILRVVLTMAGLLHRQKGHFQVTRRAQKLLADHRAGSLYARLFKTYFRKFNIGYLDYGARSGELQHTIGFSFYMISVHGDQWQQENPLIERLMLPLVRDLLEIPGLPDAPIWAVRNRVVEPLESFGLLERRNVGQDEPYIGPFEIRKTPLFDKFLTFDPDVD